MTSEPHVVWPAERFYWAEIDTSRLQSRPTSRRLGYLFESELPASLESVHVVFRHIGANRYLACGVEHDRLARLIADSPGTRTLTPESVPQFINAKLEPSTLNLLTGPFEPREVRVAKRRSLVAAVGLVVVCLAIVAFGAEARVTAYRAASATNEAVRVRVLATALGDAAARPNADLLIAGELSRLRATRANTAESARGMALAGNAAELLAGLFAAWPRGVDCRLDTVTVVPTSVTLSGTVKESTAAQRISDALTAATAPTAQGVIASAGWRATQPRVDVREGEATFTIRLERQEESR